MLITTQAVTYNVTTTVEKEDGTTEEVIEKRVRTFEVTDIDGKISVKEVAHSNVEGSDLAVVKRERTFTEAILSQNGKKLEGDNVIVKSTSEYKYIENLFNDPANTSGGSTAGFTKETTDVYTLTERTTLGGDYKGFEYYAKKQMNEALSAQKAKFGIDENETFTIIRNDDGTETKVEVKGGYTNSLTSHDYFTYYIYITKTTTSTVVTKANYGTLDFAFVPEDEKEETLTYYEIGGYTNVESSALSKSVSAYDTAMTYQKSARTALETAQDAFDDTDKAYDKAKKEVDEARKADKAVEAARSARKSAYEALEHLTLT